MREELTGLAEPGRQLLAQHLWVLLSALPVALVLLAHDARPGVLAVLLYVFLEVSTFLLELSWGWNPGNAGLEAYAAMASLAKWAALSVAVYSAVATLLLPTNAGACVVLLVFLYGARETIHQFGTTYGPLSSQGSLEPDWKARASASFVGAFRCSFALGLLLAYGHLLAAWALGPQAVADQVLFALFCPVVRVFGLLSVQEQLAAALLQTGLLDALTLYVDVAFAIHCLVEVPVAFALLAFGSPLAFGVALLAHSVAEVAYSHMLCALHQQRADKQDTRAPQHVAFCNVRAPSGLGAMLAGSFRPQLEGSPLLPGSSAGRASTSGVTASTETRDCIRSIGDRVRALLDEHHDLQHRLKEGKEKAAAQVWTYMEYKAALSAHTLACACAALFAGLLCALLPVPQSMLEAILRITALVVLRIVVDCWAYFHLARALGGYPAVASESKMTLLYRGMVCALPVTCIVAAF